MRFVICLLCVVLWNHLTIMGCLAQSPSQGNAEEIPKLQNPVSVKYLNRHLRKTSPRLVLTPETERNLRKKLETDPVVKNFYRAIRLNAEEIRKQPLLERNMIGIRLLQTSQEMMYRMNMLGMVYLMEKDKKILQRINDELVAVCNFQDWNPRHYLDVAEMSMAVALAIDWTAGDLPASTIVLAKNALIEKGINPSFKGKPNEPKTGPIWTTYRRTNNWNPVCNSSMIAAAVTIAEEDPELSARTISRALETLPLSLKNYGPDGVCYEGVTYWDYGTGYAVIASSILESAFGTDFGIAEYPSFIESAVCRLLCVAPSGEYYNFSDCGDTGKGNDIILAWFARQTGDELYYEEQKYLRSPDSMGKLSRFAGCGLVWLSQFESKTRTSLPPAWKGEGRDTPVNQAVPKIPNSNYLVIFRGGEDDPGHYYFAGKGGRARSSHGHMDAGSFVFELDGIRWVIDPGNQNYHAVGQAGYNQWNGSQEGQRWCLLSKNNFGHSTLAVDDSRFNVDGIATLIDFKSGDTPEATFNMTEIYKGHLKNARRKFVKDTDHSITIEDNFILEDSTKFLKWAITTTAEVYPTLSGAILTKDGKQLNLEIIDPPNVRTSVIMMDPPPLQVDKRIRGFKRIEVRVPAYLYPDGDGTIRVRLYSNE